MTIVCITASNIKHAGENSTSLKICYLIKNIINKAYPENTDINIIPLVNSELKPCIGCGICFNQDKCIYDDNFNIIYEQLIKADALFIVSAHYAPIPAKLSMLLEKIEQLAFLKRFNNADYRSPLYRKPVGLIAHGGGTKELTKYYKEPVLDSIWNALSYPVEMNVIGENNGVILPVKSVTKVEGSIFPVQKYDWQDISIILTPFISEVINTIE